MATQVYTSEWGRAALPTEMASVSIVPEPEYSDLQQKPSKECKHLHIHVHPSQTQDLRMCLYSDGETMLGSYFCPCRSYSCVHQCLQIYQEQFLMRTQELYHCRPSKQSSSRQYSYKIYTLEVTGGLAG